MQHGEGDLRLESEREGWGLGRGGGVGVERDDVLLGAEEGG